MNITGETCSSTLTFLRYQNLLANTFWAVIYANFCVHS